MALTSALIVTAAVFSGLLSFFGPDARGNTPSHAKSVATSSLVYFRPVLCYAAPEVAPKGSSLTDFPRGEEAIPACQRNYQLTTSNLDVTPSHSSPQGYTSNNSEPDPQYATYRSTSVHKAGYGSSSVLVPGIGPTCGGVKFRCVLGPPEMSSRSVGNVTVKQDQDHQWVVNYMTAGGANSALWDKVVQANFHQILGVEVGGVVYSAVLIEPLAPSFYSFDGRGELSGFLSHAEAMHLAREMKADRG